MGLAPFGVHPEVCHFLDTVGSPSRKAFHFRMGEDWKNFKSSTHEWRHGYRRDYLDDTLPANAAAAIQSETEEALLEYARWLRRESSSENLCLGGGVALNCIANSRIALESGFSKVFVPPAPGDDGIAAGCALYGAAIRGELKRGEYPLSLGRRYPHLPAEIEALGLCRMAISGSVEEWVALAIAAGDVIAWYQAGAEFGPRALGQRSFIADPRSPTMQCHLNRSVKNREPFRPFAPVVLEQRVLDWFDVCHPSYYMSFVARVKPAKRALVPAITHVDGTARYQVLRQRDNPQLYRVISEFERLTGVPMLLNTSFNRDAEPIVETPAEAARCAFASNVDYLVLDGVVYQGDKGGN
jgi:carbamoyltransferase